MKRLIVVVATLLLGASVYAVVFGLWYGRNVVDENAFTEHALTSFTLDGSYEALGVIVADKVVDEYPGLALFGSSLSTLFGVLLSTPPFEPALEELARDIHDRLLEDVGGPVVVDLDAYRQEVVDGLNALAPGVVDLVPDDAFREYTLFEESDIPELARETARARTFAIAAAVVGALAATSIVVMATSVGEVFVAFGVAMFAAGGAIWLLTPASREALRVAIQDDAYRVVALNLFDTITSSVDALVLVLVVVGSILAVGGGVLLVMQRRSSKPIDQPADR